jgi:EAL domain-containing protein (putative c-di-GMP-specific phosphodiesterase class I)
MNNPEYWRIVVSQCDFAFQPIVRAENGLCYGVEALLRGYESAGFATIPEVFESAWRNGMLHRLELGLREAALRKFRRVPDSKTLRLFLNVDNRVMEMPDYDPDASRELIRRFRLDPARVCFELSEQHAYKCYDRTKEILAGYREMGASIALDDYGTGVSGLELLYHSEPDFIKIDRFFIHGLDRDARKQLFVGGIAQMALSLGCAVIAEGVETEAEFLACRDLGIGLVQGWLVQAPVLDPGLIRGGYPLTTTSLASA